MDASDLRLIRLGARHFNNMQGLRHVVMGVFLAVGSAVYLNRPTPTAEFFVLLLGLPPLLPALFLVDRYYARRFGRTKQTYYVYFMAQGFVVGLLSAVERHWNGGGPSLVCLLLATFPVWIVFDGWPVRSYHLLTVVAVVFMSLSHTRVPGELTPEVWFAQGALWIGLVLILTGWADHRVLARLMHRPLPAPSSEFHEHSL